MPEPKLVRDGNLRLAAIAGQGWPVDPLAIGRELAEALAQQGIHAHGAVQVMIASAPDDEPPAAWDCHVGLAVSGMPRPGAVLASGGRMLIEDYRQLEALTLPHHGPVRELAATWRRLADHGRSLGHRLRPYWRVALRRRQLADGNLLPTAEVAVFLDR